MLNKATIYNLIPYNLFDLEQNAKENDYDILTVTISIADKSNRHVLLSKEL